MKKNESVYKQAIEAFGAYAQILVAAEECSELSAVLLHYLRFGEDEYKKKVEEEIADVTIMLKQLTYLFDLPNIEFNKQEKIQRLVNRIQELNK
jgi:NTP pyrophosphatase (non-canonical NTP hydrolase)